RSPAASMPSSSVRCCPTRRTPGSRVRPPRSATRSLLPATSTSPRRCVPWRKSEPTSFGWSGRARVCCRRSLEGIDMSERQTLLTSIAQTIQDYHNGSLPKPITDHVDCWVRQFDADVQIPILREVDHVLKNTYFSKEKVSKFLRGAIRTAKLTGANPK